MQKLHSHRRRRRLPLNRLTAVEALESRRLLAAAPDLVQFAKDLEAAEVKFYCAAWFDGCTTQSQIFTDGAKDLPFTEVTGPDRLINQAGIDAAIGDVPAWDFPGQPRQEIFLDLATISQLSGVPIPTSETPSFETLTPQTVLIGSPLHLPIDAYDPDGNELTVTVIVEDPTLLEATVLSGNRSIRIDMEGFGDMVFELFEQRAPRPAGRVADFADSGFYDGLTFHRVADDFVLQGGDPLGDGTGGSTLGDFDDQFHPDLQHNRTGILSFAKSNDDTNDSQFFITEGPTRHLDFNHSIFGQLVEGEEVREAISEMNTNGPPANRPDVPIVISTIDVFDDTENAVVFLKAVGNQTGSTNVTVRVTDTDGNFSEQTIAVTLVPDVTNGQPFLAPFFPPTEIFKNQPLEIQLASIDVENDAVAYDAAYIPPAPDVINATVLVDSVTGLVTVTPVANYVGPILVGVGVLPGPGVIGNGASDIDIQFFTINVVEPPAFHRPEAPTDVNGDGEVTTADAFIIINTLSRNGDTIELGSAAADGLNPELMVNVAPDQRISAQDALIVINALERQGVGDSEAFGARTTSAGLVSTTSFAGESVAISNIRNLWLVEDDDEEDWWRTPETFDLI